MRTQSSSEPGSRPAGYTVRLVTPLTIEQTNVLAEAKSSGNPTVHPFPQETSADHRGNSPVSAPVDKETAKLKHVDYVVV